MVDHSDGDLPIFESGAIMWYLGMQHDPQGRVFPKASICQTWPLSPRPWSNVGVPTCLSQALASLDLQ